MSFDVRTTSCFEKSAKRLSKRYRSIKSDLGALIELLSVNPEQGVELSPGIRKIRMSIESKGRGKSGGARVITYTIHVDETSGVVYLIDIYDKSDYDTVDIALVKAAVEDISR